MNLQHLPIEMLNEIASYLRGRDFLSFACTCRAFASAGQAARREKERWIVRRTDHEFGYAGRLPDGRMHGESCICRPQVSLIGSFRYGERHGRWRVYDWPARIKWQVSYAMDRGAVRAVGHRLDRPATTLYVVHMTHGRIDGPFLAWHENGEVARSGLCLTKRATRSSDQSSPFFRKVGLWRRYYESGHLCSEKWYDMQGRPHGIVHKFHANGRLRFRGRFVHGRKTGVHRTFNDAGDLTCLERFSEGALVYRA